MVDVRWYYNSRSASLGTAASDLEGGSFGTSRRRRRLPIERLDGSIVRCVMMFGYMHDTRLLTFLPLVCVGKETKGRVM